MISVLSYMNICIHENIWSLVRGENDQNCEPSLVKQVQKIRAKLSQVEPYINQLKPALF